MLKFLVLILTLFLTGCTNTDNLNRQNNINEFTENNDNINMGNTPSPSVQEKKDENEVLSSYSTPILDKKKSRLKNINLAVDALNDVTLKSGETLSFNGKVGPRTASRGYEKALAIIRREKVLEYGGGVCQVSTTLYNAALRANLEIVERHEHEKEVGYVKKGEDATVSYGTLDLKIKNNKNVPVKLRLTADKKTVNVVIVTAT